jgi:hypothetical protein
LGSPAPRYYLDEVRQVRFEPGNHLIVIAIGEMMLQVIDHLATALPIFTFYPFANR